MMGLFVFVLLRYICEQEATLIRKLLRMKSLNLISNWSRQKILCFSTPNFMQPLTIIDVLVLPQLICP